MPLNSICQENRFTKTLIPHVSIILDGLPNSWKVCTSSQRGPEIHSPKKRSGPNRKWCVLQTAQKRRQGCLCISDASQVFLPKRQHNWGYSIGFKSWESFLSDKFRERTFSQSHSVTVIKTQASVLPRFSSFAFFFTV